MKGVAQLVRASVREMRHLVNVLESPAATPEATLTACAHSRLLNACLTLVHSDNNANGMVFVDLKSLHHAGVSSGQLVSTKEDVQWYMVLQAATPTEMLSPIPFLRRLGFTVLVRTHCFEGQQPLERAPFYILAKNFQPNEKLVSEQRLHVLPGEPV